MLANYSFIGLFFIAAVSFPILPLVGAYFLRPRRPTEIKLDTYECGLEAIGDIWVQFKVQYYLYALAFVVFDIEVVFLYPWAVIARSLKMFGFWEMLVYIGIMLVGFFYVWKKGALDWGNPSARRGEV